MWDSNIYYHPESYGLEVVADIEWRDDSYEFDMTVVWRDKEGNFYAADDSGCSCPSPFEDYNSLESLGEPMTAMQVIGYLQERLGHEWTNKTVAEPKVFEAISTIRSS